MTPIVLKSKDDVAKMAPLADGTYKVTVATTDSANRTDTLSGTLVVDKGSYAEKGGKSLTFDQFKQGLVDNKFDTTSQVQITIEDDAPAAKDKTAGAAPETPWLLYAGGALLLWLLLSKKN